MFCAFYPAIAISVIRLVEVRYSMGEDVLSLNSGIEEYVKRFGGVGHFVEKILDSLDFPFAIINVKTFEVEVCNSKDFSPGVKCYDLYCGSGNKCIDCPMDIVIKNKDRICFEKGGEDICAIPIFEKGGDVVSIIKYRIKKKELIKEKIIDKTSRKYEDMFYNILQNSRDVVYRYDFIDDEFEYVSESVFTLLGFPLGEFIRMTFDDFLSNIHVDDVGGVCNGTSCSGESACECEYRWKCKDGNYLWVLDKRTWFFDGDGRRICVIGDIKDISKEKEKYEDYDRLKEKVSLMKRQEAKAKEKISLTDKEKLVLWGLCRWTLLNDEELSGKLGLKRSTLTAIKNRLKSRDWFFLKYIPNFAKLGCQFAGVFDGSIGGRKIRKLDLEPLKKVPEVIFSNYQDEKFFGVFVSDKYVAFRRFLEAFEEGNRKALSMGFEENSFFYDLEKFELMDFSEIVNSLFGLGRKEKAVVHNFENEVVDLNVNEKRVLHAMIQDANMSSSEIAKKVWISKPTVIKIRNRLLNEGFIYAMIVPDFRKLGLEYFGRFSYEFDSGVPADIKKREDVPRTVLRVSGKKKVSKFILFASKGDYTQEVDLIKETHRKSGVYCRFKSEIFAIQKRGKNNFNMEPFINELLFEKDI